MSVTIEAIGPDRLAEYAEVPMLCHVESILAVDEIEGGVGGIGLRLRPIQYPFTKNYDAYRDGGPLNWPKRFDISRWGMWIARAGGEPIGGAAVAWKTPCFEMLEGRDDLAVLWEIRVREMSQRQGVGAALFREAASWARANGCKLLKIETQNVNVTACRFYAAMGCFLGRIDRLAYTQWPDMADEAMLVWNLDLARERS